MGFGLIPEILRKTEWIDRSDDIILVLLAVMISSWYLYGKNRFWRSLVPFSLLIVTPVTKAVGLALEIGNRMRREMNSVCNTCFGPIVIVSGYPVYNEDQRRHRAELDQY